MYWRSALLAAVAVSASPNCFSFKDCDSCTHASTWVWGQHCRWCTKDGHCHAELSTMNPCGEGKSNDFKPEQCNGTTPAPAPEPSMKVNSTFASEVVAVLLKLLNVSDVNAKTCVTDFGRAEIYLKGFGTDLKSKLYSNAVAELSRGISALSNSVADCGIPEVQHKLDALAKKIHFANISTTVFDKAVKIIVDASDLWPDFLALAEAVDSRDPTAIGTKINAFLDHWTSVTGGCAADNKACKLIDGLLRVISAGALDVAPCEAAINPAVIDFQNGARLFKSKNYTAAVLQFAAGVDVLAKATTTDACGLKSIAGAIGDLSPKLQAAVVKVENSTAVKIIVGSADVYTELYAAAEDLSKGDFAGVGIQMGALLAQLRSSGCSNPACIVMEGLLGSLQVGFTDLKACESDLETVWSNITGFVAALRAKQWKQSLLELGDVLKGLGDSVRGCGVKAESQVLEDMAKRLHLDTAATVIGDTVQVLVNGSDITSDLQKIIVDSVNKDWARLGSDLGVLSNWVAGTGCHSFVCRLLEGLLTEAENVLTDLKPCETELRAAEGQFIAGAAAMKQKKVGNAIEYWASGLNDVAKSIKICGIATDLDYLEQEANVLRLGNITAIGGISKVLVHGADFYEALYGAVEDFEQHDYRSAGVEVGKVMQQLSEWTTGHLCTSDACYVVNGVMQYLADLQSDAKHCGADFKLLWGNMTAAYHDLRSQDKSKVFGFNHDKAMIRQGIRDIGYAFTDLANSVADCHMAELAAVIEQIAVKLGIVPEVGWVETVIKILIEGVPVEREVANACQDWADHNWPGVGYNIIKLVKSLLAGEDLRVQAAPAAVYV